MRSYHKIGIKIYKGAPPTQNNIKFSLLKSFDFSNIEKKFDSEVLKKIEEIKESAEPIYAWAGVKRVEKKISAGDSFLFVIVNDKKAYLFKYLGGVLDRKLQMQQYVGWQGRGYQNVVFFQDRKIINLSDKQIKYLFDLTSCRHNNSGFSDYKYDLVITGSKAEDLRNILDFQF